MGVHRGRAEQDPRHHARPRSAPRAPAGGGSLAGARFQTWLSGPSGNFVSVWRHPEFDVVFAGSQFKRPGPDWSSGYIHRDTWNRIKDHDVIPLRQVV